MKLSIITVNLNNREGLKKTLDSVAAQTWRDFEHIIVDGASTDGSVDIIKEYEQAIADSEQPVPVRWTSEPDTGIYNAMNKGIRMANGVYLLFLNSGDWLTDNVVLEKFFFINFSEDVVYGYLRLDKPEGLISASSPRNLTLRTFVEGTINHTGNALIRKDAFNKYGFYDEHLKIVSDWKWFLQAVGLSDATARYIDINLAVFDCTGISEIQKNKLQEERDKALKETVPNRILEDYLQFSNFEEKMFDQERRIRESISYKLGSKIIAPIKKIRSLFHL